MKFLMLDTNIYIDMVVSRNKSHKAESYDQLKKLLEYGEVKLIVPKVVITEVFRHIENEINKVGDSIREIKKNTSNLYWINHDEELEKFDGILKPAKANITRLIDEFDKNSDNYKMRYRERLNKLYLNENCFVVAENETIILKAMQRNIHKKRPFHYKGKDNQKDSMADAIIIETLINIKDILHFDNDDCIYFISRNPADFSVDKNNHQNLLHNDILSSIEEKSMSNNIKYSTLFTNTLLLEFKYEIEAVGLTEQIEAEAEFERRLAIQESFDLYDDSNRESAGLSSLSSDYEEKISQLDGVVDFMNLIEETEKDIVNKFEEYFNIFDEFQNMVKNKTLDELKQIINSNPLFRCFLADYSNEDEIRDVIINLIDFKIGAKDYARYGDEIKANDYFSINDDLFTFFDGMNNKYRLVSLGIINPCNDETDTIYLYIYKNNIIIHEGQIDIYYGFMHFDDDGNAADGAEEDISIYIEDLENNLLGIKESITDDLNKKINMLRSIINIL